MLNIRSIQNEIPIDTKLRAIGDFVMYVNGNPEYVYMCGATYQESIFYLMYRQMFFENELKDFMYHIVRCDRDWTLKNLIKSMYGENPYHTFNFYSIDTFDLNIDVVLRDWRED